MSIHVHDVQQFTRFLAFVLLGLSAGAMARFYVTVSNRRIKSMPWWAMIAVFCWIIALISSTYENLHENQWDWLQTPMIIIGCVCCIIGVKPYLKFKHTYKNFFKSFKKTPIKT